MLDRLGSIHIVARYLCAGLLLLPGLPAQRPPIASGSTTRQVQLTVVVRDKKGRPVTDLGVGEFTLKDEGKRQEIRIIHRPGGQGGVTVILLDGYNSRWVGEFPQRDEQIRFVDLATARCSLVKYLLQIQPNDHVAIYTLGKRRLRVVHDLREEPAALLKALSTYLAEGTPELASGSAKAALAKAALAKAAATVAGSLEKALAAADAVEGIMSVPDERSKRLMQRTERPAMDWGDIQGPSLNTMEAIAHQLAGVPGPKDLVWVSDFGFEVLAGYGVFAPARSPAGRSVEYPATGSARDLAFRALHAANVTFYPVSITSLLPDLKLKFFNTQISMDFLAKHMGGKAYYRRKGVMDSIPQAVLDVQASYTLAFHPSEQKMNGRFRRIEVKVARPGVSVRHRPGYYDLSEALFDEKTIKNVIRAALWSPLNATGLGVEARVEVRDTAEPGALAVRVKVDPGSIVLIQRGDRLVGKLHFALVQPDASTEQYAGDPPFVPSGLPVLFQTRENSAKQDGFLEVADLWVRPDAYATFLKDGFVYKTVLPRNKEATELRVVVRDDVSGSIGRVVVPFSKIGDSQ